MIKWDVKIGDEIKYFDPELSYELTQYRPITETKGLDFDPKPFTEVGQFKLITGRYTTFPHGGKQHRDFWQEQHRRCVEGYTVDGYRITGDHYFFLNFYQLQQVQDVVVTGSGRTTAFPSFIQQQYEYYHYIELQESSKLDVLTLKSRGVGWSEISASMGASKYTTTPKYISIYTAFYEDYLLGTGGVVTKCWDNLEYLNTETEGGMRRLRQSVNTTNRKRQSVLDKDKTERGHMQEISLIITDKPRKLRGTRVDRLYFEEIGSNEHSIKLWIQSLALVSVQGNKFGTRLGWGTGGDVGPQLQGLEKMFFHPTDYNILPYKHNCTKNGEYVFSQYFVPQYQCQAGFLDGRGVTKMKEAKEHFVKERNKLINNLEDYLINCQEYCFTPEEQLSRQGVNSFNQLKLAEQRLNIELHKKTEDGSPLPEVERGFLDWTHDSNDDINGVKWTKDPRGNILVLEKPLKDADGVVVKNLYVAGVDSIDQGVMDSVVGQDGSKFCITVKKRTFGNGGDKYVCVYLDRPPVAKEAYAIAQKILWWYGCKANLEDTKITFRQYLRERKWDNKMLMKRPQFGLQDPMTQRFKKNNSELWGTPGSPKMIGHGLELITDYIEDHCHKIFFIEMIDQLQRYSYENKGAFDIVAAMIMTEIGDEDMFNVKIKDMQTEKRQHKDIGYYYDDSGVKHWGVIPGKSNSNIKVCVPQIWRVN